MWPTCRVASTWLPMPLSSRYSFARTWLIPASCFDVMACHGVMVQPGLNVVISITSIIMAIINIIGSRDRRQTPNRPLCLSKFRRHSGSHTETSTGITSTDQQRSFGRKLPKACRFPAQNDGTTIDGRPCLLAERRAPTTCKTLCRPTIWLPWSGNHQFD